MKDLTNIAHPPELGDGQVRLRALRAADKAAVVKACNDGLIGSFCFRVPSPYRGSDFDEFLAYNERFWPDQSVANWTVVDPQSDTLLAMISLQVIAVRQAGEIGYWCAPWARGRGVMSAAVRLVRNWAFDKLELERLELATDVDNLGSQRVAQAAGFRREGLARGYLAARGMRRDSIVFGMLPADPREPHVPLPEPWLDDGHLVVRPFVPDDAPAVQAACDDPDVALGITLLPSPYTLADAEEFIIASRRDLAAGERARLAISDCASGDLLGSVSLDLRTERQAAEMGYWVKREARHRGVALSAARLVIGWAFDELGLERLELLIYPGNIASQTLAEKLGFHREGLLRGYVAADPGKDRASRVVPSDDGTLPARDDEVLYALVRA
jgi:RimJ/RimL family protein N-acetyltransferase